MKLCKKCGEEKSIDSFSVRKKSRDGRQANCRECQNKMSRKNYLKDIESSRRKRKEWIEKNRKKHNENVRNYYARKRQDGCDNQVQ